MKSDCYLGREAGRQLWKDIAVPGLAVAAATVAELVLGFPFLIRDFVV